jgi:L-fucose mutarotase/ribose pyranase (RbsD/FucU family)
MPLVGNALYNMVSNSIAMLAPSEPRLYCNTGINKGLIYQA